MGHFAEELDQLQIRLLEMGGLVEAAIHRSVRCVVQRDQALAQEVLQGEARINQMEIANDEVAVSLLALHQPMARDLRFLTAAIKINADLERMGDMAVNIVERALSILSHGRIEPRIDIPEMARLTESMVHRSLDAFVKRDGELAREVLLADDAVDDMRDATYRELISFMQNQPSELAPAVDLIFVARYLERIADHATNIAEDVLFLVEGVDVRHHAEVRQGI